MRSLSLPVHRKDTTGTELDEYLNRLWKPRNTSPQNECLKQDDNCFNLESLRQYLQKAYYIVSPIDAFTNNTYKNFDEMQLIFKTITGSYGYAFWWERTVRYTKVSYVIRYLPDRTSQDCDQIFTSDFSLTHTVLHILSHQEVCLKLPVI